MTEDYPIRDDAFVDPDEAEHARPITDTEIYEGDLAALGGSAVPAGSASVEDLTSLELRTDETDDPNVAAEEGQTWIPPVDPPVVADRDAQGGARVAAGFGVTAEAEPFDADHHASALPDDDEMTARVREALGDDARTSRIADVITVETNGGVVTLHGMVQDIDDADLLAEVASAVTGVTDVVDETRVEGL